MDADATGIARDFYASGAVEARGLSRFDRLTVLAAATVGASILLSSYGAKAAQPVPDPPVEQRLAAAEQIVPGRSVAAAYATDAGGRPLPFLGLARQMERYGGAFAGLSSKPGIEQAERKVRADVERMGSIAVLIPTDGKLACYAAVRRFPDATAAMDAITGIATATPERIAALHRRGYVKPLGVETQARMIGRHEFEGHCLDARFSPRSIPAGDRQDNHRAEVRADTAMALSWMRDAHRAGGAERFRLATDEVRAFADQRALTVFELNARYAYSRADGVNYHTSPALLAAIEFAQQRAGLAFSDPGHLTNLSDRDLHREIDRIASAHTMDGARLERVGREISQILNRPARHLGDDGAPSLASLPREQVVAFSPETIQALRTANDAYGRLLGASPSKVVAASAPMARNRGTLER